MPRASLFMSGTLRVTSDKEGMAMCSEPSARCADPPSGKFFSVRRWSRCLRVKGKSSFSSACNEHKHECHGITLVGLTRLRAPKGKALESNLPMR